MVDSQHGSRGPPATSHVTLVYGFEPDPVPILSRPTEAQTALGRAK